ncbi:YggT family protein [Imbroritus primus]|uniref:YggT family protein n=1 Tax=Imbroritus primus TaxID=3058603 RepID=A0ACD3SNJ5_9BURK|nr:YggT family protein [Burkholderiaceae bacterium PBA]
MLNEIGRFLVDLLLTLFGAALLLRAWSQAVRLPPGNPLSRALFQITDWLVLPLRKVIPGAGGIDWASLVGAWLAALCYLGMVLLLAGTSPALLIPTGLLTALLVVLKWAVSLVMWMTLLMALLSWINPHSPVMGFLQALLAPLLNPLRKFIPLVGGLDLSPLALFIFAQIGLIIITRSGGMLFGL